MAARDEDIKKNLHGSVRGHPGREREKEKKKDLNTSEAGWQKQKSLLLLYCTLPVPTRGSNGRSDTLSRDSQQSFWGHAPTLCDTVNTDV